MRANEIIKKNNNHNNNPFGHSNEVSMPTMVDRLVTAVGFTGITQNTQETYRGGHNK
jgi:hypothetical protein